MDPLDQNQIKFSSKFNCFIFKTLSLLRKVFLNRNPMFAEAQTDPSCSNMTINQIYTNLDLIRMLHSSAGFRLFAFLLNLFQTVFHKCYLVYENLSAAKSNATSQEASSDSSHTTNTNTTVTNTNVTEHYLENSKALSAKNEIKNIDDPSTDDEANMNVNHAETAEESDDYLLIGSWFDEQLNSDSNTQATATTNVVSSNTNALADTNTNLTDMATMASGTGAISSGGLSNCINSSNATQILDSTFELDQSSNQNSGVSCFKSFLLVYLIQLKTSILYSVYNYIKW